MGPHHGGGRRSLRRRERAHEHGCACGSERTPVRSLLTAGQRISSIPRTVAHGEHAREPRERGRDGRRACAGRSRRRGRGLALVVVERAGAERSDRRFDPASLMRRMASSPSIPGMRRSMSTRSGCQSAWIEMAPVRPRPCASRSRDPTAAPRGRRGCDVVDDEHLAVSSRPRHDGASAARPRAPAGDASPRKVQRERAPGARRLSTVRSPLISRAWARLMARPRPVPPARAPLELLEWLEYPSSLARRCRSPCPRRRSQRELVVASALAEASRRIEPRSVNLRALLTRLIRICFTLPASPSSAGRQIRQRTRA